MPTRLWFSPLHVGYRYESPHRPQKTIQNPADSFHPIFPPTPNLRRFNAASSSPGGDSSRRSAPHPRQGGGAPEWGAYPCVVLFAPRFALAEGRRAGARATLRVDLVARFRILAEGEARRSEGDPAHQSRRSAIHPRRGGGAPERGRPCASISSPGDSSSPRGRRGEGEGATAALISPAARRCLHSRGRAEGAASSPRRKGLELAPTRALTSFGEEVEATSPRRSSSSAVASVGDFDEAEVTALAPERKGEGLELLALSVRRQLIGTAFQVLS